MIHRSTSFRCIATACAVVLTMAGVLVARALSVNRPGEPASQGQGESIPARPSIARPLGPPRVATELVNMLGSSVDVSCASCHANFSPNTQRRTGHDLTEFHQGLHFSHANMTCLSCHNSQNYNTLKLADGSLIGFEDVMTLCSQCHTPQARDFQHGAHGGMNGYWDATRGPQFRKTCVDCHDPHAPAFPAMRPTFKPHDRFLSPISHTQRSSAGSDGHAH